MSGRIAHRPRYRDTRQYISPSFYARQKFFPKYWAYRPQKPAFERHPLGYKLSLLPAGYARLNGLMLYHL
jgi:hypothetical protein